MEIMEEESVKLVRLGSVAELHINRPKALNALNQDVLQSLILALGKLEKDTEMRALIISGAGDKSFVAGADVASMADLGPKPIADYVEQGQRALRALENFPVPVIAAVNGYALGGGMELAMACDIIVASRKAKFGQPEVNLGIIPGFGGTQRLIQRCGIGTARKLIFTGEIISAEEAMRLHLVDQIAEPEQLLAEAKKVADVIAQKAPLAVRSAKRVLRQSQETSLLSGLRLEVEEFLKLFATVDREEGMKAFLQKRTAVFNGR